jgi:hypothetical protein
MKNLNHLKTFESYSEYNYYNEGVETAQIVLPEKAKLKLKNFATNNKELLKRILASFANCKTQEDVQKILNNKVGVNEGFTGVYDFLYKVFAGLGLSAGIIAFLSSVTTAYQAMQEMYPSTAISVLIVSGISAIIFYLISIVFDKLNDNSSGGGTKSLPK